MYVLCAYTLYIEEERVSDLGFRVEGLDRGLIRHGRTSCVVTRVLSPG